jgi:fructokinase
VKIVSIGEILWDVFEGAEHLGGAPFNFAVHARRLGHDVLFVSAVANDERGNRALEQVVECGLIPRFIKQVPDRPTGRADVRLAAGQPQFKLHRPSAYDYVHLTDLDLAEISRFSPDWIYFGTLTQTSAVTRNSTRLLLESNLGVLRFYDVNLRAGAYTPELVRELMSECNVVKLNEKEVAEVQEFMGSRHESLESFCRSYATDFGWGAVCVTRGQAGAAVWVDGSFALTAGYSVPVADTVGAGDAFSAAFLHGIDQGWAPGEIGDFANRVAALVCARSGGTPEWSVEEALALVPSAS